MPSRPLLDDVELPQVQDIETSEDEVLAEHAVPALEGDFLQRLGRRAAGISLQGVLTGPEAKEGLEKLREKFRLATPVSFVADIVTAHKVDKVLIETLGIRELAGKPERFEYALRLREFLPPPQVGTEEPPPPEPEQPEPDVETGTLIVEVIVEGDPNFDFSTVTVTVEGTQEDGTALSRTLTNRENNIWTEEDFPPGEYTVQAVVTDPQPMNGSERATVRAGQREQVTITLRAQQAADIAITFVIHFWFDRAFIEPCMRPVMRQIADFASNQTDLKLVILGHTDLVGDDDYNQSLSERRARSAFAYLTFGLDPAVAITEWDRLRRPRQAGVQGRINDNWDVREYQHILQELGFYSGNINEIHDEATDTAVRDFQRSQGLAVDGVVGDNTWLALIRAYLSQDPLLVPPDKFLRNAKDTCDDGVLKWLGCGEKDPVKDTQDAWRPNRRTEFLFVRVDALPTDDVPAPITFDLPAPGVVGNSWCLGSTSTTKPRSCFVVPHVPPGKESCPSQNRTRLTRRPFDIRKIAVRGSIKFEDDTPLADAEFVLTAPDGEYLHTDAAGNPDLAERPAGPIRGRPIPDRTDINGEFSYPRETPVGVYTLEVKGPFVVRLKGEPAEAAKGNVVCKQLDGSSNFDVIVRSPRPRTTSLEFVAADNVESLLTEVQVGDNMRVRADLFDVVGDEVTVEIIGSNVIRALPPIPPPPPVTTTALEFVAADNVENLVTAVRAGETMRVRADIPDATSDEITIQITSSPT